MASHFRMSLRLDYCNNNFILRVAAARKQVQQHCMRLAAQQKPCRQLSLHHLARVWAAKGRHQRNCSGPAMGPALPAVMLRQRLNPLTGVSEWEVVTDQDQDQDQDQGDCTSAAKWELGRTSYLDMLNDRARNAAYSRAIEKAVQGGRHVLDIGSGTGLLSMMALRALREQGSAGDMEGTEAAADTRVTSCESFLPMLRLARKVLRSNGMSLGVRLVHKRSDEMQVGIDMPSRADVLVSEILDSELLGEGLIPTLRHAHAHLLTPNPRTVPFKATIYGQVVECEFFRRCHDLRGSEADGLSLHGSLDSWLPTKCELQIDALSNNLRVLSEPFEVFTFDFSKMPSDYRQIVLEVPVTQGGTVHALVSWWVLQLDEECSVTYSTAPQWAQLVGSVPHVGVSPWREHWKQSVWFFRRQDLEVACDATLKIEAVHDSISVRYHVHKSDQEESISEAYRYSETAKNCTRLAMKLERVGMLGDQQLRSLVLTAVTKATEGRTQSRCLVLDDSLLMTLVAARASTLSKVTTLLPGFKNHNPDLIRSVLESNDVQPQRINVLSKKASSLTLEDLSGQKVDIILAEPYYWDNEGLLPWQNFRFWFERTLLDPLLADNFTIVPLRAILRGMAVHLPDLWESRCSLGLVEGFDHTCVNVALGACGQLPEPLEGPVLPYALWQCGHMEELTEAFDLIEFNFDRKVETARGQTKVPITQSGSCHALVLWIDWVYDESGELIYSTGPSGSNPTFWKQGVKLLRAPVSVQPPSSYGEADPCRGSELVIVTAVFESSDGDIVVDAQFL